MSVGLPIDCALSRTKVYQVESKDGGVVIKITCGKCSANERVAGVTHWPPVMAARKFRHRGWQVDDTGDKAVCPTCLHAKPGKREVPIGKSVAPPPPPPLSLVQAHIDRAVTARGMPVVGSAGESDRPVKDLDFGGALGEDGDGRAPVRALPYAELPMPCRTLLDEIDALKAECPTTRRCVTCRGPLDEHDKYFCSSRCNQWAYTLRTGRIPPRPQYARICVVCQLPIGPHRTMRSDTCSDECTKKKSTKAFKERITGATSPTPPTETTFTMSPDVVRKQQRLFKLLEEHYDSNAGRYRETWSDQKIATDIGVSVLEVSTTRRSLYGDIVDTTAKDAIATAISALEEGITAANLAVEAMKKQKTALEKKREKLDKDRS